MSKLHQRRLVNWVGISLIALAMTLVAQAGPVEAGNKKFTLINVIFDGTKIWLPSSLVVEEGDEVELTLINKLDVPHGFKIATAGIEAVVNAKSKTTVKFTAKGTGIQPFTCHLHPTHIGGQMMVVESGSRSASGRAKKH